MSKTKFQWGSPLLMGDNTTPGLQIPEEIKKIMPDIFKAVRDFGLDFYPTVVQMLTYDEISEVAAYGGFPVRFPHWKWGMEYNELQQGYEHGMHRIYEMVVNCLHPCMPVLTNNGTIPATDVKVGDLVFAGPNKPRKVVAVTRQGVSDTVEVKIRGFADNLICTPNHKWRVMTDKGFEWKEAGKLTSGDVLVGGDCYNDYADSPADLSWTMERVLNETAPTHRSILKEIKNPANMTFELAELLGVIIGDGSQGVESRENYVSVTIDKRLPEYINYIEKAI